MGGTARMAPEPTTVVEALAAAVAQAGCDHFFTLMGAGNLRLVHHLHGQHGVRIHHLRHENGTIGAADGFARSTGEVGWCSVTQGPGFTNTITALLTAHHGGSPMILIVSDTSNLDPRKHPFAGGVQALPPEALLDPLGIASVRATGTDAAATLRSAVDRAVAEHRPVVFVMPAGLDQIASQPGSAQPRVARGAAHPQVRPDEVARAADTLCEAERIVILAGNGAVAADAASEVANLAETLGSYVATTVPASGIMGDHAAQIGPFGGFSVGRTEELIKEADSVIAIGACLDAFQTRKGAFVDRRTVVRVDVDPQPVEGAAEQAMITADARAGTRALTVELRARGIHRGSPEPITDEQVTDDISTEGALDPRTLSLEFERVLCQRRRVFVDNGHFGAFPVIYLRHRAPRSLIWMPDFGAVGSALAAGFASAVAQPDVLSVLFIGDCGLYMTLGDLETAVRERVPLVVVCMNDGAAGSELAHMKDWGLPPEQAVFGYNDIAALAAGMGATAASVRNIGQLEYVFSSWNRSSGPLVLDCHISRAVRSPIYDHV